MYTWKSYFVVQADYQHWADNALFESLGHLRPEVLGRDEGLPFKSIHGTLDHLLALSRFWMERLQGADAELNYRELVHPVWRDLQNALRHETRRTQAWLDQRPESFFDEGIRFGGRDGAMWVRDALTHLFSQYELHRGQSSAAAVRLGAPNPEMDYLHYRRAMDKLLEESSRSPRPGPSGADRG